MRISDWSSDVCSSDLDGANRHRPALLRARARRQAGIDRRAARWIDDDEQSDEGRDEKIDHGCFGAATWSSMTVAISLPSHRRIVTRRDLSVRTVEVQLKVWRSEERRVGKECVSTGRSRW